jgi:type I restriction enzyme, S subunit
VVRDNWKTERLGNAATLQRGYDLPHRLRKAGPIPIVTSSGIEDTHSKAMVKGPGVVTGRYGTIGEVFFVRGDFWPLNTTLYVRDFHGNDPLFVSYLLRTIDFHSHSGKTGVPGVNRNDLHEIEVSLPPTRAEQETIAETLRDADALIESLEQLIAKKRHLKQGAMQELLTGRHRLPAFRGKWEIRTLDSLGSWKGGMTPSMAEDDYWQNGTVPWISSGDVKAVRLTSTGFSVTALALTDGKTTLIPSNCVVVVTRSGILRKFLPVAMNMIPMAINQDIKALIPAQDVFPEFILQALINSGDKILAGCLKSGSTVESIEFRWLKMFALPLPPYNEQSAIATVFRDMDAEIAALEGKLLKARQLKQGMMQELLTGKVRLV